MPTKPTAKKRGHCPQRFTQKQVREAVIEAGGILTAAARNLDCARCTVYEYIERYPPLKDVLSEAREGSLDLAESKLMEAIDAGNLTAIIFFLKTQGKSRGYVERSQHDLISGTSDGEPLEVTFKINGRASEAAEQRP